MPFNPKNGECLCPRCGKFWIAKADEHGNFSEPKSCAGCKSKVWNKPRKYNLGTLESSLIITKREKLTGRAAKKANKVAIEKAGTELSEEYKSSILRQKIGAYLPKLEDIPARKAPTTPVKDWRYYENGSGRAKKYKNLDECLASAEKRLTEREDRFRELEIRLKAQGITKDDLDRCSTFDPAGNIYLVVNHITAYKADVNAVLKEMGEPPRFSVEKGNFQIKWREGDFTDEDKVFKEYVTITIADSKKFKFELHLAEENGLWYVGYDYELKDHYGGGCAPVRNEYRTAYESRDQAIIRNLADLSTNPHKEVSETARTFLGKWKHERLHQIRENLSPEQLEGLNNRFLHVGITQTIIEYGNKYDANTSAD